MGQKRIESRGGRVGTVPLRVWKQLLHPVRAEIIEAMRALGRSTIKEVAGVLSRTAPALYPHFARLVSLGVVVERPARRLARHRERVYELSARDFVPDFRDASDAVVGEIALTTAAGVTASAVRTLRAAAKARRLRVACADANHGILHEVVWLNGEELAEVRAALKQLKRLAGERKSPAGREPHLLVALYMPIAGSARRSRRAAGRQRGAGSGTGRGGRSRRSASHGS